MAKILLVEDDRQLAATVEKMLLRAGHVVVRAENGVLGVGLYPQEAPDLVITDIVMPEQDGLQTIQQILALAADIPIIAVSGGGRTGHGGFLAAAKKLGAREVLQKPFRLEALIETVNRCLNPACAETARRTRVA